MKEHPPKKAGSQDIKPAEADRVEVIKPSLSGNPYFSFRYSYREISLSGGRTHVRARETRFEDGRVTSEEFEGTLDHDVYLTAVREMQRLVLSQAAAFLKMFSLFLPASTKPRSD